jgi:hypothetical protein
MSNVIQVTANQNTPARPWYERDLTIMFDKVGHYEATSHGLRLRFLVVEHEGERGKFRLAIPLFFDVVHRERGRTVVDETIYVRHRDNRGLNIPLDRLRGRGGLLPSSRRYDEDAQYLLADMERVLLASMAWALIEFTDPPEFASQQAPH